MSQILKEAQRREMEAFALGFVAGTHFKEMKFTEERANTFTSHLGLARAIVRWIDNDLESLNQSLAATFQATINGGLNSPYEEIERLLETDSLLHQITSLASRVHDHGKLQMDDERIKLLNEATAKYLAQKP